MSLESSSFVASSAQTDYTARLLALLHDSRKDLKPRDQQVEVLKNLEEGFDTVLKAPCGFGKTLIFQVFGLLHRRQPAITVVISPLKAIQRDQCAETATYVGARPVVLNGDSNSPALRARIQAGEYTHIWVSPEVAISYQFTEILKSSIFQHRVCLLAIDELHCVSEEQWGSFRSEFTQLAIVRHVLPSAVPCFGTTATLSLRQWPEIARTIEFSRDTRIVAAPVDRTNLFLAATAEWSVKDALQRIVSFLLQLQAQDPAKRHPKAILYFFEIEQCRETVGKLYDIYSLLQKRGAVHMSLPERFAMEYHGRLDPETAAQTHSSLLSHNQCRILCATSAYGFGVNPPDIDLVVKFGRCNKVDTWQMAGRAARKLDRGYFLHVGEQRLISALPTAASRQLASQTKVRGRGGRMSKASRQSFQSSPLGTAEVEVPDMDIDSPRPGKRIKTEKHPLTEDEMAFWAPTEQRCVRHYLLSEFDRSAAQSCTECSRCTPELVRFAVHPSLEPPAISREQRTLNDAVQSQVRARLGDLRSRLAMTSSIWEENECAAQMTTPKERERFVLSDARLEYFAENAVKVLGEEDGRLAWQWKGNKDWCARLREEMRIGVEQAKEIITTATALGARGFSFSQKARRLASSFEAPASPPLAPQTPARIRRPLAERDINVVALATAASSPQRQRPAGLRSAPKRSEKAARE